MAHPKDNILIVGAGPTGLTAALVLARKGIKPRIIDKLDHPITTSNALAIQPRTLELWKELELIDDALSEGHHLKGITISTEKRLLVKAHFDKLPTPYPFILALPQAKTEQLLTRHLSKYGVTVERGVTLETLSEKEHGVEAVCNRQTNTCSWVLGCDGAKSDVRRMANIAFQGENLPQHFIMADLKIDWDRDPSEGHVFYHSNGPLVFFPLDHQGFGRLIIDVSSDQRLKQEAHPILDDFKELMSQRCSVKATLHDPSWISSFWVHSRVARSYRKGRLFLAGDAAHQHSPVGGQGLNIGVQDAYLLANLLAGVLNEQKSEKELEGYESVRRPIGEHIVRRATTMTRIITTHSKSLQMMRNAMFYTFLGIPSLRRKVLMQLTQLVYR